MQEVEGQVSFPTGEASQPLETSIKPLSTSEGSDTGLKQAVDALRESKERYRTVISNASIVLFALNTAGVFTLSEGRGLQALDLQPGQVVGLSVFDIYSDLPQTLDHLRRALAGETLTTIDHIGNATFETQLTPLRNADGQLIGATGVAIDISERVKVEEILQAREHYFRALTEQASDLVFILDATGIYRYASPSHQCIMGYPPEMLIGINAFDFIHPDDFQEALTNFTVALQSSKTVIRTECRARHANGSWIHLECVGRNCLEDPAIAGLIVNARDITKRKAMEEALRHQALHDALTDLPNRTLLQERLAQTIQTAAQNSSRTALLMMDLDRFKDINDTFGPHHGDLLLQQVGARLRHAVDSANTVARLGGDEFAVLLPTANEASAKQVAAALHTALEEPFTIAGYPLQVTASIGVAQYPIHGTDPLTLMRCADVAMYTAKRTHEGYALYDISHNDQDTSRRLALIGALRHAIAAHELMLYYQPKVDLKTGATCSVEALARWKHPTYGFVPPEQFIALAEQTGLIAPLTHWVLETAIRQCRDWLKAGLDINVAVNLSMWNLRDITLPDTIAALLARYHVPPRLFRVELTESAIMTDADRALEVLMRLFAQGVHVSIDDFGTGYSSLAYLKRLPVDELKIDRSFVQHMTTIETDATIVRSTVMMAHSLGLHVVAEGIEDHDTWQLLATLDCDAAQGYYMSHPLPAPDFENWLRKTKQTVTH